MKSLLSFAALTMLLAISFASCKKNSDPGPVQTQPALVDTGKAHLEFFAVVGSSNLNLGNQWYKNAHGDSFKATKLNYYVSNVVLNGSAGAAGYTEPNSYHLIEHGAGSETTFDMAGVPAGKYKSVTFMIGVDSAHNVSGAQGGDLDPVKGNFWSWNTGYIMLKFEGTSPQAVNANNTGGTLLMHCGGFSGANSVLKTVTLDFPNEIEVTARSTPHIHVQADLLKMFQSPNTIDFAQVQRIHMPGASARALSDNYAGMFSITYAGE